MSSRTRTKLVTISPTIARRLAITRQRLAGPRPAAGEQGILDVMRDIRCLQLDPINAVARSPLLVLWSRLGHYDTAALGRLLWQERVLFEYWAHAASIVLSQDYAIFKQRMRNYANGGWRQHVREWLAENEALRRHILHRLEAGGPLAPSDFDDDVAELAWQSGGWSNGRAVNRMLDFLWLEGEVVVAGRRGRTRLWDLPGRFLGKEVTEREIPKQEAVRRAVQLSLRALGVGTAAHVREHFTRKSYPGLKQILADLLSQGAIVPVEIVQNGAGWPGDWFVHREDLSLLERLQDGEWQPRTTLLSPFDNLICDRARTEQLFDFHFRLEIYVPKAEREYGYYVLPVLHGDRFIARLDAKVDRKAGRLNVNAVYAEPDVVTGEETGRALSEAVARLARFVEAGEIAYGAVVPDGWRPYLGQAPAGL